MAGENKSTKRNVDDFLATARKKFRLSADSENDMRAVALDDLEFRAGQQWPQNVESERRMDNRPCLVINRMPQFIRNVTNDQRQNRPSIKVKPVDDAADVETAKIMQGMIRHIEYNSGADVAYDTSFSGAAIKGFGYYRVVTRYVDESSFDQEILIEDIEDDFTVYFDPNSKRPDGSDAEWAFIVEEMSKDEFEREYPKAEASLMDDWSSLGDEIRDWLRQDGVRIAEYFYKEYEKDELILTVDNRVFFRSELKELFPEGFDESEIKQVRPTQRPVVKWCKFNGLEVLEETEWAGKYIPIIPVIGDKLIVNGKKILEGVIRHAKDSQRMYNYWASTETETIALSPKAPWVVAEGQIPKAYEALWKAANKKSHAYLPYNPVSHEGHMVPAPQRQVFEPPVQAITMARMNASEDMKTTMGIYDASLGAQSNETSGIAIQRRNMQAQTSNFHLVDNLHRSLRHTGRILVDLIPKIYDTARAQRIIGEEGDEEVVRIHEEFKKKDGEVVRYDLGRGKYDVVIDTGPSFATKRQEAAATIEKMVRAAPQLMGIVGDLLVKNLDLPGASEMAERIKKSLPPGLAEQDGEAKVPPQIQAQVQEMSQMIEALTEKLNQATKVIDEKQIELSSKERIEYAKMETDVLIEKMKQASSVAMKRVDAHLQELQQYQQLRQKPPQGEMSNNPVELP